MITVRLLLMILAIMCLFLAALNVQPPRGNFLARRLALVGLGYDHYCLMNLEFSLAHADVTGVTCVWA